jgi:choline-sulfatase
MTVHDAQMNRPFEAEEATMRTSGHYDHVVLVSVDGLRSDAVPGPFRSLWDPSDQPAPGPGIMSLGRLLHRGAWFGNVITASPDPAVAYGALLTGQYPLHNGLYDQQGSLRAPSLFTHARRQGRRTVLSTDVPGVFGPGQGFTREVDTCLHGDDEGFLDAIAAAETTLACAHFSPGLGAFADEPGTTPEAALRTYLDAVERFAANRLVPFLDRLTRQVGEAGRRLLLVIMAGHGVAWDESEDGLPGALAGGVLRVPLVVVADGITSSRHAHRIRTVDVAPTVLELAGVSVAVTGLFDGRSLAAVVLGREELDGDAPAVAGAYQRDWTVEAGYLDACKVVRRGRRGEPRPEAVRVERLDPEGEPRAAVLEDGGEVLAMIDDYRSALEEPGQVAVTEEIRIQLRSQGYAV